MATGSWSFWSDGDGDRSMARRKRVRSDEGENSAPKRARSGRRGTKASVNDENASPTGDQPSRARRGAPERRTTLKSESPVDSSSLSDPPSVISPPVPPIPIPPPPKRRTTRTKTAAETHSAKDHEAALNRFVRDTDTDSTDSLPKHAANNDEDDSEQDWEDIDLMHPVPKTSTDSAHLEVTLDKTRHSMRIK
jgi:hypothetical protein